MRRRARSRAWPLALCVLLAGPVAAQPLPGPLAALTPVPPPPKAQATPAYEDRVLESGPQPDLAEQGEEGYDASGWARSLRLDYSLGASRGPGKAQVRALSFSGYLETPQHGTLSLLGNLIHSTSDPMPLAGVQRTDARLHTWRLDQRALPLEGYWLADHSAGDIHTLVPALARSLTRVFLPTTPLSGLGGHWVRGSGLELNASAGRPGLFTGLDVSGFERGRGRLATAGGQLRLVDRRDSRVDAALQWVQAQDAQQAGMPAGSRVTGTWASMAWEGAAPWGPPLRLTNTSEPLATRPGGARLQLNLLQSGGVDGDATGGWLDASWRTQLVQNSAGLFHFAPGLRWGVTSMPADLRGAYVRGDVAMRQWQLGWSGETSSNTGGGAASTFASVYGRYILDLRNAVDATLAMRSGSGEAESLQVHWDRGSDWGQTRWRGSLLHARGVRTVFVGADQTWALSAPSMLATSLGWQRSEGNGLGSAIWTWAVLASVSPAARLTLDASVHGAQGAGARSLLANVGLNWQFARDWGLALRYTESRGQDPQAVEVLSALTAATQVPLPQRVASRSVQLNLRYETRAGTLPVPLGGSRGSGSGSLVGTVFFDADHNGKREASEQGVPNVTVVLDGRFVARTDSTGRYEFPSVAAGDHVLQVQSDNVPLPWSPANPNPVRTAVPVRGTTVEDFPLQRER